MNKRSTARERHGSPPASILAERTSGTWPTDGRGARHGAIVGSIDDWAREYRLTRVERAILDDALRGTNRRAIAAHRGITINTLKTHLRHLLRKTGDDTLAHAVQRALRTIIFSKSDTVSPLGVTRGARRRAVLRERDSRQKRRRARRAK